MPALHNDELMIPSLLARGVSLEDARGYAIVGCIEPIIPGKQGYRSAGMSFTNFPKILELALHGGRDPLSGRAPVPRRAAAWPPSAASRRCWRLSRVQMQHFVRLRVAGEHVIDAAIEELVPEPFCTGLVQDCLQRGKTPKEGGSVYDLVTGPETGVTNAANSLAAIRELVFERGALSGGRLAAALDSDFAGAAGEQVRQMLLNKAPKFGNDEDAVDLLAREVYMIFIRELEKYRTARHGRGPLGCISYPCTATISANVPSGLCVGASAEGRKAGEAAGRRLLALPRDRPAGTHGGHQLGGQDAEHADHGREPAQPEAAPQLPGHLRRGGPSWRRWSAPSSRRRAGTSSSTSSPSATLRAAQREPEKYRDLVVRVAGYSALFDNLEPATQEDIIARTEHVL